MTTIGIYGIENRVENKWYVGKSINIYKRLGGHIDRLRRGDHPLSDLQEDYNRLGKDSFEVYILEFCTKDNLNERECFWIKEKGAVENGYCKSTGGYSANGIKMSDETKKLLSKQREGHLVSQETRNKISQSNKGRVPGFKGHHHTEDTKEKLSKMKRGVARPKYVIEAMRQSRIGKPAHNCRRVLCVDTGEIFNSIRLAGESVGGSGSGLSGALTNGKTYKGYLFKYIDSIIEEAG